MKGLETLFTNAVLHWTGSGVDVNSFPILPSGVTVTPNGTWDSDVTLPNGKVIKTFTAANSNYLSLSDNDAWTFNDSFTISFWIKLTAVNTYYGLMGQYNATTPYCILWIGTSKNIAMQYRSGSTPTYDATSVGGPLSTTDWYHITLVRSGTGTIYLYVTGITYTWTETITGSQAWSNSSDSLVIGKSGSSDTNPFGGNLKDLIIWKGHALTTPELNIIMQKTHPLTGEGIIPGITISGQVYDYWRAY